VKDKLNIAVVTTMQFPSGAASVNRIMSYSKGIVELGHKVTVLSTNTGSLEYKIIDGIKYMCMQKPSKNKLIRIFNYIILLPRLIKNISHAKEKFDILILVSNSLIIIYPIFVLCKIFGIKYILEKSEFPFVLNKKSVFGKLFAKIYVLTTYKLFDGLIIMTNLLNEYFEDKVKHSCKRIIIPMTVDVNRFCNVTINNDLGDYIAYCGDLGGNKDGVKNLIHSFSLIADNYPSLRLLLIGGTKKNEELKELEQYTEFLKSRNVCFYGLVNRDRIPSLLSNSKLLALARPSSLQASGGFPTKLGEYLSAGKPVLVTKVGDIPVYLTDNENAFLVEPDNNFEFAKKISFILDNYDFALDVAKKGKLLTETIFNYKVQAMRLSDYLHSL